MTPERVTFDHLALDGTIVTDDGDGKHRHWNGVTDEYVATHDGDALECRLWIAGEDEGAPRPGPIVFDVGDDQAARALRAFGPGTTAGGRAEAGWHDVGRIAEDGIHFKPADRQAWPNSSDALTCKDGDQ